MLEPFLSPWRRPRAEKGAVPWLVLEMRCGQCVEQAQGPRGCDGGPRSAAWCERSGWRQSQPRITNRKVGSEARLPELTFQHNSMALGRILSL